MKKNISINISGIIFHIEEDGYENLKKYLDSINKYFSTFEDSSEILADIESRIAEIFLSKLNEEKQIITFEDVNSLIATMGSVSDFRAVEEEPAADGAKTSGQQSYQSSSTGGASANPFKASKQLMRDQQRKILGGVCAGIANYLNIDALWVRLIFALLTFAYGLTFFIYIIMWLIVPGSFDLEEPVVGKKMYRDPERKVIGGVSGGVAAFMGIDIVAVRVLFIALTFAGGLGLFLYIVLWLILPEARSLTDKMQMQGEPVTLSNIESTLKKNQSDKPDADETPLTRVLLFPFRLIGVVITALARVLGPLIEALRVAIGIVIVLLGIGLALSVIVAAGILFGIITSSAMSMPWVDGINETRVPVDAFVRAFPTWTGIAAFFTTLIPSVFIILLGISVIAKRIVINAATGWSLFVLFFVSVAILAVSVPKIVYSFKEDAGYTIENIYKVNNNRAVLKINEMGMDEYHAVKLTLEGYNGDVLKLVQKFEAQGASRQQAIENAKMVDYNVTVRDSIFTFDSNVQFKDDAIFRAQRVNMTLYIPYNFPFTMDEGISRLITQYVKSEYLDGYVWKMTDDGLECVSCPKEEENGTVTELRDFDEIEIRGKFDVRIIHGDDYSIEFKGSEESKNQYDIDRKGETLVIDYIGKENFDWNLKDLNIEEAKIIITVPRIEKIEATGIGQIRLNDFTDHELEIELRGPVKLKGNVEMNNISISLSGSAEAELSGRTHSLNAIVELASKLKAYNLEAHEGFIETSGASSAKVNVLDNLEIEEGIASKIEYRGHPNVTKKD
jgi:phage shock protein PspC (stress-responsive transcriptional regulator)